MIRIVKIFRPKIDLQLMKRVGHPLDSATLYGPLHNQLAVDNYTNVLKEASTLGGTIEVGGKVIDRAGFFVEPTIVTNLPHDSPGTFYDC